MTDTTQTPFTAAERAAAEDRATRMVWAIAPLLQHPADPTLTINRFGTFTRTGQDVADILHILAVTAGTLAKRVYPRPENADTYAVVVAHSTGTDTEADRVLNLATEILSAHLNDDTHTAQELIHEEIFHRDFPELGGQQLAGTLMRFIADLNEEWDPDAVPLAISDDLAEFTDQMRASGTFDAAATTADPIRYRLPNAVPTPRDVQHGTIAPTPASVARVARRAARKIRRGL